MAHSMTGYGRVQRSEPGWTAVWEVKSVNSRYLDLKWRMPSALRSLEAGWERVVRGKAARGRLDISLYVEAAEARMLAPTLNKELARAMFAQLADLAKSMHQLYEPDIGRVMGISALWQEGAAEPDPGLAASLTASLAEALDLWNQSREAEGKTVAQDILNRFETLDALAQRIGERVPAVLREKSAQLAERIKTLLAQAGAVNPEMNGDRMLQEVALLTDKLDVSEEISRLAAHLAALRKVLSNGGETGKRLDFLLQEAFREINTCGNKSQDAEVSRLVVEFKAELEKCREQAQNLE